MRTEFVKEKGHCHDSSAGDTRTSCTACPTTYVTCRTEFAIQSQLSRITFLAELNISKTRYDMILLLQVCLTIMTRCAACLVL
jgi:hypothetical protein